MQGLHHGTAFALLRRSPGGDRKAPWSPPQRRKLLKNRKKKAKLFPLPSTRNPFLVAPIHFNRVGPRRFPKGDRKALWSPPQRRNLLRNGKRSKALFLASHKKSVSCGRFALFMGKFFSAIRKKGRPFSCQQQENAFLQIPILHCGKGPKVSKGRPESPLVASAEAKSFVIRKRKLGPFPAFCKKAVLYTNFYLLQRAEGFQRATGKPFGRLRRGDTLCDTGKES